MSDRKRAPHTVGLHSEASGVASGKPEPHSISTENPRSVVSSMRHRELRGESNKTAVFHLHQAEPRAQVTAPVDAIGGKVAFYMLTRDPRLAQKLDCNVKCLRTGCIIIGTRRD